jgi:hypothetical protein
LKWLYKIVSVKKRLTEDRGYRRNNLNVKDGSGGAELGRFRGSSSEKAD